MDSSWNNKHVYRDSTGQYIIHPGFVNNPQSVEVSHSTRPFPSTVTTTKQNHYSLQDGDSMSLITQEHKSSPVHLVDQLKARKISYYSSE